MIMKKMTTILALAATLLTAMPCSASAQAGTSTAQADGDADSKYATGLISKGQAAPDFTLSTVDGKKLTLSKLRGHYVVLDFWASWCPDCRRDIPSMKRMYETFAPKGVEFVGVSFDDDKSKLQKAVSDLGIEYTQVSELKKWKETATSKKFRISWIPTMYLISPEGKVVLATVMSDKLEAELNKIFPSCDD